VQPLLQWKSNNYYIICVCVCVCVCIVALYRVSQELRSLLRDLIPELILSQKCHIHKGPIRNDSAVMSF